METLFKSHGIKFMANIKGTFLKKECPVNTIARGETIL